MRLAFESISLLDTRGRTVTMEHAGTGGKLLNFRFVQAPGRYELETIADGNKITRMVDLRYGQHLRADLVLSVF